VGEAPITCESAETVALLACTTGGLLLFGLSHTSTVGAGASLTAACCMAPCELTPQMSASEILNTGQLVGCPAQSPLLGMFAESTTGPMAQRLRMLLLGLFTIAPRSRPSFSLPPRRAGGGRASCPGACSALAKVSSRPSFLAAEPA